jgi:hypothetical protein
MRYASMPTRKVKDSLRIHRKGPGTEKVFVIVKWNAKLNKITPLKGHKS